MNCLPLSPEAGIHIGGRTRVFPTEIIFCEGDRNYTHVHFAHRPKLTLSITMRILHERLGEGQFLRISRSMLVNRDCIAAYEGHKVRLHNGMVLPIARRRAMRGVLQGEEW